jgi:hypothetical protein
MLLYWDVPQLHTINPDDRADAYNEEMKEPIAAFAELGAQLVRSIDRRPWRRGLLGAWGSTPNGPARF